MMQLKNLNANVFDLVVAAVLLVGLLRGYKRGMSQEMMPLLQWLMIILLGAHLNEPFGQALNTVSGLNLTICHVSAYLFVAMVIKWVFAAIKHSYGEKITSVDAFGKAEYYYGILAGGLRFACMLIFGLALLNSVYISDASRAANTKRQTDVFGFAFIPTLGLVQQEVFVKSLTGPFIKKYLSTLLVKPDVPSTMPKKPEGLGKQRERLMKEAVNPK